MKRHFNRMARQSAAVMLGAALIFNTSNLSTPVFSAGAENAAEPAGVTCGAFTVTGGTSGTDYTYESNVLTILKDTKLTISGTSTTDRIEAAGGVNANITLSNVSIDVSGIEGAAAFKIADNSAGNVTVTLDGTNVLKSGANCAGLQKNGESGVGTLTITGSGSLTAVGGGSSAGIGGSGSDSRNGTGGSTANITIKNGTITAQGGTIDVLLTGNYFTQIGGAGIGGGANGSGTGICITGGTVNATGGGSDSNGGAGIGGGCNGSGTVTISGNADVTAQGGAIAAGIGAGCCSSIDNGACGNVTIEGGTVIAAGGTNPGYGGGCGAGIGSGLNSHANVTITGGTVTSTGGSSAGRGYGGAGIGSSGGFGNATVKISGGTVKAKGGDDKHGGAGIGGGETSDYNANITITGGTVTATGGSDVSSNGSGGPGSGIGLNAGGRGSFTFSTTGNGGTGNAFIIAKGGTGAAANGDGITNGVPNAGNGVIINGETTTWGVNSYSLGQNVEIPSGATLTVSDGKTLTFSGTITNNGTLLIEKGGALNGGTLNGNGSFVITELTGDMITVPTDLFYNGNDRTDYIKQNTTLATKTYCGKEFQVTGWTQSVAKVNDLEYTVTYTPNEGISDTAITKTVTLAQSGTNITAKIDKTAYTYGDTITLAVTAKPTGKAPAVAMLADFGNPALGQVAVYKDGTQVSEPKTPNADGTCTLAVDTKVIGVGEQQALTVKYVESTVMAGAESDVITVTVKPATLTITGATLAPKTYDGKTTATVTDVTFSGYVEGDSPLTASDYTATAEFDNADAGDKKTATVTVELADTVKNYTLPQNNTVTLTDQTISKADVTLTFNDQTITYGDTLAPAMVVPAAEITYSYTGDAEGNGLPKNAGTYTVTATVANTNNYNGTTATSKLTISKADNPPKKPGGAIIVRKSCETVGGAELPEGWEWKNPETELTVGGEAIDATACYIGEDKDNYNNIEVIIKITRSECEHTNTEIKGAVAATCTKAGYSGDTYCLDCQQTISKGVETELAAHTEKSEITKEATYTEEGTKTISCSVCGAFIREEIIPKKPKPSGEEPSSPDTPSEPNTPDKPDKPDDTKPDDETDKPSIKGEDGKEGWDVIRSEVDAADNGGKITVEMNGATEVPGDILNSIKGEDITITFDMGDGVSWSVNGKDVTEAAGTVDFGVKVGSSDIPVDVVNNVTGENYSMQLSLNYDGNFGFKATLSVELGTESAGSYASLYYYNEQSGEAELISESKITENGIANLEFTHASDYVIVVNEKSKSDVDDTDESSEGTSANGDSDPDGNPGTGVNISYIAALISATSVVGLFATRRRKKGRGC